jgi:histidinol-phosphatase (PHP family)
VEQDVFSNTSCAEYDYVIGSVHYVKIGEEYIPIDSNAELLSRAAKEGFHNDIYALCEDYYRSVASVYEKTHCQIIGHFDLITKHSEKEHFFDTGSDEYRECAVRAMEALKGKIPYFEVNTGAISRGYRTTPYPDPFILKEIARLGGKIVINGDCHNKKCLGDFLEDAAALAKKCGFSERWLLTENGWIPEKL